MIEKLQGTVANATVPFLLGLFKPLKIHQPANQKYYDAGG